MFELQRHPILFVLPLSDLPQALWFEILEEGSSLRLRSDSPAEMSSWVQAISIAIREAKNEKVKFVRRLSGVRVADFNHNSITSNGRAAPNTNNVIPEIAQPTTHALQGNNPFGFVAESNISGIGSGAGEVDFATGIQQSSCSTCHRICSSPLFCYNCNTNFNFYK